MFVAPNLAARIERVEARLSLAIATAAQISAGRLSDAKAEPSSRQSAG